MNLQELLNTIRDNATTSYQERIPEATRTNLESIRYAMIDDNNIMVANEFMTTLLNKLVKSVVHTKLFENPLNLPNKFEFLISVVATPLIILAPSTFEHTDFPDVFIV